MTIVQRLYIIRHADPEYYGDTLTEHGQLEAEALAKRLANDPQFALTKIYSSPMGRAKATAEYTSKQLGIPIEIEDWTKELTHWGRISNESGDRPGEGGFALWDIAGEVVRGFVPRVNDETQWERVPDMLAVKEEYERLIEHSDRFFAKLGLERDGGRYRISNKKQVRQQQVAVFCHGGFGLTWLSHLLYLPVSLFWCSFWYVCIALSMDGIAYYKSAVAWWLALGWHLVALPRYCLKNVSKTLQCHVV